MNAIAVFPATFDPITNGHVSVAVRSAAFFDELVVGVYAHDATTTGQKATLFTVEERVDLARQATAHVPNVRVRAFDGLAVDFARQESAAAIVRGLRVADDFEFERQMAMLNRHIAPNIETLLLIADPENAFVSSSLVREVALMGGDVRRLVPPCVAAALARKAAQAAHPDMLDSQGGDRGS